MSDAGSARPRFHFTARSGWINDPHGIVYRNGGYDAFFQYVPGSTAWAPNCHWGHARGPDLFALEELPAAIAPGDGDDGIWTGCLVMDEAGAARAFYTATTVPDFGIGRVRMARPADADWGEWVKGDVVAEAPSSLDLIAYRDPFVFRDGETWRMFVGAAVSDGTAAALSYSSADLETWRYDGIAASRSTEERDPVWMGALWECPQLVELDGRHVLISSVWDADALHYAGYGIGDYDSASFRAASWGRLTYGSSYYAPSLFRDAEGRPCLLFWMRGIADETEGWASAHSIPHLLRREGDRLIATPHPDLEKYRGPAASPGAVLGTAADIEWRPGSEGRLEVGDDLGRVFDISLSGGTLRFTSETLAEEMPCDGGPVRVVLDGPIVEVSTAAGLLGGILRAPQGGFVVQTSEGELTAWPLIR